MALEIPLSSFSLLNESVALFNRNVTLNFPPVLEECTNCYLDTFSNRSTNRYKPGGPQSFIAGQPCPFCNGIGYKELRSTENIVVRIYWDRSSWVKSIPLNLPDGSIQIIAKLDYLPSLEMCEYMQVKYDGIDGFKTLNYVREGDHYPQGFPTNTQKYVYGFWKRQ